MDGQSDSLCEASATSQKMSTATRNRSNMKVHSVFTGQDCVPLVQITQAATFRPRSSAKGSATGEDGNCLCCRGECCCWKPTVVAGVGRIDISRPEQPVMAQKAKIAKKRQDVERIVVKAKRAIERQMMDLKSGVRFPPLQWSCISKKNRKAVKVAKRRCQIEAGKTSKCELIAASYQKAAAIRQVQRVLTEQLLAGRNFQRSSHGLFGQVCCISADALELINK